MSLRLEMLQVARLAPAILGDEAVGLIRQFVTSHQNDDGGFSDRDGGSDLYYTSFAIDVLTAIQADLSEEKLRCFLDTCVQDLAELDFVHLCCLARCYSALSNPPTEEKCHRSSRRSKNTGLPMEVTIRQPDSTRAQHTPVFSHTEPTQIIALRCRTKPVWRVVSTRSGHLTGRGRMTP